MTESNRLASLNARIANAARVEGSDSQRIRRALAFQRLLARMADSGWVLKGGYCLEARLPRQARATQDIDFVRRQTSPSEDELLDELDAVLGRVLLDDGFSFDARSARLTRAAEDPAPAWRVRVDCLVDGRLFEPLKLDVVSQFDEVAEAVERLVVVPPIAGEGSVRSSCLQWMCINMQQRSFTHSGVCMQGSGRRPASRTSSIWCCSRRRGW